jgi:lysophospholipase L1-like esterase
MKYSALGSVFLIFVLGLAAFVVVATYSAPASAKTIRVACIGDSITAGSGYTYKLQMLLGRSYTVANFGVSGSTVSLDSNLPYMNQTEFKKAEEFDPDIVVIMLGTNDAKPEVACDDNFEADYTQLVTALQGLEGNQMIWVVKSPPIFNNATSYSNTLLVNTVLPHIDNLADDLNLPTVDMYNALSSPDYFVDGVHPNPSGASVIAYNIYDAITLPDGSPDTTCFGADYYG